MQLDLKNVRVTYTVKEVIAVVAVLITLVTHIVRTEMQHGYDVKQIMQLGSDVAKCQQELNEHKRVAGL